MLLVDATGQLGPHHLVHDHQPDGPAAPRVGYRSAEVPLPRLPQRPVVALVAGGHRVPAGPSPLPPIPPAGHRVEVGRRPARFDDMGIDYLPQSAIITDEISGREKGRPMRHTHGILPRHRLAWGFTATAVVGVLAATAAPAIAQGSTAASSPVTYTYTQVNDQANTFNQELGINDQQVIAGYMGSGSTTNPNKGYTVLPPYAQSDFDRGELPGFSSDPGHRAQRRRHDGRVLRQQGGGQHRLRAHERRFRVGC